MSAATTAGPVMEVQFPGGKQVTASYKGLEIRTDQPEKAGGGGAHPAPFDLFLASLATCAGYYILEFCQKREIPMDGIRLEQHFERDPETRQITTIVQEVVLPDGFPQKYHKAVTRAAEMCTVKKLVENSPEFEVRVS